MLRILFQEKLENTVRADGYFNHNYEEEWLYDPEVVQIVRDIDKSELVGQCVISPVLGSISVERISGGAKALILLLKTDVVINLTAMGQNCVPWLIEISRRKDITACMTGSDLNFNAYDFDSFCLNDNIVMHTGVELTKKMAHYALEELAKYEVEKWSEKDI